MSIYNSLNKDKQSYKYQQFFNIISKHTKYG